MPGFFIDLLCAIPPVAKIPHLQVVLDMIIS